MWMTSQIRDDITSVSLRYFCCTYKEDVAWCFNLHIGYNSLYLIETDMCIKMYWKNTDKIEGRKKKICRKLPVCVYIDITIKHRMLCEL